MRVLSSGVGCAFGFLPLTFHQTNTMEFALPSVLADQIASYDPVLKKEKAARKKSSTTKRKTSEFPLGNITNLIPHNIVSEISQAVAVNKINKSEVSNRYNTFWESDIDSKGNYTRNVRAILYHYESAWFAAWLPAKEERSKYLYGFAVAFRNLSKASEKAHNLGLNTDSMSVVNLEYEMHDKKEYRVYRHYVTVDNIANDKCNRSLWNIPGICSYNRKKSSELYRNCISPFGESIKNSIPQWEDSFGLWDRVNPKTNNYAAILKHCTGSQARLKEDFYPSVSNLLELFTPVELRSDGATYDSLGYLERNVQFGLAVNLQVYAKLNTPFFRGWLHEQCEEMVSKFNDPNTPERNQIAAPFSRILRINSWMTWILAVWPDTPIDYFQSHMTQLISIAPSRTTHNTSFVKEDVVHLWLNKHMKVSSLFKIIDSMHKEHLAEIENQVRKQGECKRAEIEKRYFDHTFGVIPPFRHGNMLKDTIGMLSRVLDNVIENNLPELAPPKRWRIVEFHDYVQAEAWKLKNENVPMPQDLFPEPVKVQRQEETWTFFQPINTHQLAAWGQAVRNCVGSASSYAEGVKKKQHFIVLCMVNQAPRFTIQLKVNNALMHVTQITDLSNARLSSDQQEVYNEVFKMALDIRAKELAPTKEIENEKVEA